MLRSGRTREKDSFRLLQFFVSAAAVTLVILAWSTAYAKSPVSHKTFSSPGEAVKALVNAVKASDTKSLLAIMGPRSKHIVSSGDPVEDRRGREWFVRRYEEKNRLAEETPDRIILHA